MIESQLQSNANCEHPATEQNALAPAVQEAHLIKYDSACRALAEASDVDEVKDVLDQALKLKLYAKLAENKQMERDAAAIRVRAQRQLGEMMAAQGQNGRQGEGRSPKGIGTRAPGYKKTRTADAPITLAEAGIDKNLAHRARKLAKLSPKEFDKEVAEMLQGQPRHFGHPARCQTCETHRRPCRSCRQSCGWRPCRRWPTTSGSLLRQRRKGRVFGAI